MSDVTLIKVKKSTHRRLQAEKLLRNAGSFDDALDELFREIGKDKKKKRSELYEMFSV